MKLLASALCVAATLASPASAAYLFQVSQSGANVVVTGSGSLNLAGLTARGTTFSNAGIRGTAALVVIGTSTNNVAVYSGYAGPASIGGSTTFVTANDEVGRAVGFNTVTNSLFFDPTYVSGTEFGTSTATFNNRTIASLGLTPGEYVYTFGLGANADRFTVRIDNVRIDGVPEPATWAMMIAGFGAVGGAMRRRPRAIAAA